MSRLVLAVLALVAALGGGTAAAAPPPAAAGAAAHAVTPVRGLKPFRMIVRGNLVRTVTWSTELGNPADPCVALDRNSGKQVQVIAFSAVTGRGNTPGRIGGRLIRGQFLADVDGDGARVQVTRSWTRSGRASGFSSNPQCGCGPTSEAGPCGPPEPPPTTGPNDCGPRKSARSRVAIRWTAQDDDGLAPLGNNVLEISGLGTRLQGFTRCEFKGESANLDFTIPFAAPPSGNRTVRFSRTRACSLPNRPPEFTCSVKEEVEVDLTRL
ncbi:MAG: hypothetical protein MUE51_13165 [Thermoleophilia bacterium]|jgi:hypothetical protein|nr:hypothetical protein [Thermoleophilia bacterium]